MIINNNLPAINAHKQFGINQAEEIKSKEKLSSGSRINRAADDAANLAISEKMAGQIRGLLQASRNTQDSVSKIQTAESGLSQTQDKLNRMRELSVQAANGTYTDSDRVGIQSEIKQLQSEIDRIGNTTEFNNEKLLDGSAVEITTQTGANSGQTHSVSISDMRSEALGVDRVDLSTQVSASAAIDAIDSAVQIVSDQRSSIGATQNSLEYAASNIGATTENLQSAQSRIRDADMAKEIMESATNAILQQASLAMIAQGNLNLLSVSQLMR
ncbi:MAG: flagellin [Chitinispirillales bacterium]|jgi:flagellin|nr:flagellin [Chitinispirillales bacterium]